MYSSYFLERLKIKIIHRKVYIYNYLFPDIRFQRCNKLELCPVVVYRPSLISDQTMLSAPADQSDSTIIFQTTRNVFIDNWEWKWADLM